MHNFEGATRKVERDSSRFPVRRRRKALINGMNPVLLLTLTSFFAVSANAADFSSDIQPLVAKYCLACHSTEKQKGELDLERFKSESDVRKDANVWRQVLHQFEIGEMPPEGKPRPTTEEFARLKTWIQSALDAEALAQAGDPGPVVLRRLNNAEYTYTIRDLTGAPLDPAREFPVDGAAGEGFLNTGASLSMSPAMVDKQLAAAKEIASHAVLTPTGMRFSPSDLRGDWVDEILDQIRAIHLKHTGGGAVDFSYASETAPPTPRNASDGRLDVAPYLAALIEHRERLASDPSAAGKIAAKAGLNPKYARLLAAALSPKGPDSIHFNHLQKRWREIGVGETAGLAKEIRGWQDQLWRFDTIGHFGRTRPWQSPVTPLPESREFKVELKELTKNGDPNLHLFAGTAGDGGESDVVIWRQPRIARPGMPDVLLRDVRGGLAVVKAKGREVMAATEKYLAAAFELRTQTDASLEAVAEKHDLDPVFLRTWLETLGIVADGNPMVSDYLHTKQSAIGGYEGVKGWHLPGLPALSLVANSSDQALKIPGDIRAGKIAVHPRPERWVAAGWLSPIDGETRIAPSVRDAHNNCGNGVSWKLEHRRGSARSVLAEGNVDLGKIAKIDPIKKLSVRKGDLVSLVVYARDRNHYCDLTEIDLEIQALDEPDRAWSLSKDCAPDIHAGNPHDDRFGNKGVWHFFVGLDDETKNASIIPPGSLLDEWLNETDAARAATLAGRIDRLLAPSPLSLKDFMTANPGFSEADQMVRSRIASLHGAFFSRVNLPEMAAQATPEQLAKSDYGLDPGLFDSAGNLRIKAPSNLSFRLPGGSFGAGSFISTGTLDSEDGIEGSVQLNVATSAPGNPEFLQADLPVIAHNAGAAARRFRASFDAFRELFPAALCFTRIVPVDEVVTLLMFHREDAQLARLMLDAAEKKELDRLWDELEFVSLEPRRMIPAYEQLWQFESQLGKPSRFEPLEAGIRAAAAKFERRLLAAEPAHLDALLEFANRAWRRPLTTAESTGLRELYRQLRGQEMSHEEAYRLTLARVLVAPAFLYKAEAPAAGPQAAPVNAHELAARLSYFLWSSTPDNELRKAADSGELLDDEVLLAQTRRMLRDPRARRLAIEFACQWLHLRGFDELDEKSEKKFPEFARLKGPMYEETIRFFTDLFQNDRSVLSILDADHTFVNDALAAHYGLPADDTTTGLEWTRVDGLREKGRGGILAQAATLARQSGASRTSPILRGNWIVETLLGERLPRPPANVPVLPDDEAGPELNMRQVTERHTRDPACAKCHKRIDPFGYALEQFDAIGRGRADKRDVATTLPDGKQIEGLAGLRDYLIAERRDQFVQTFCRKLLGFALGRAVQLSDEPLLKEIAAALEDNDDRFIVAVEQIVLSKQFREIRGNETKRP